MLGAVGGLAVLGIAVAYIALKPDGPVYADATDRRLVIQGKAIYDQQCAACHGSDLKGQANWQSPLPEGGRPAPPHDETGHTWHHADELLFALTKDGGQVYSPPDYKNNMPGFGETLSDREILAALAYIKSTWPAEIQARQEGVTRRAGSQ